MSGSASPTSENRAAPFLKWAGGKRWFTYNHLDKLPKKFNTYFEPFMGSACMFFSIRPTKAVLADKNEELVNLFKVMKAKPHVLHGLLAQHAIAHGDAYYYEVRDETPSTSVDRAARTLYLNRACFNGIYRVNKQGIFNVPKGSKETILMDTDDFAATARALKCATILASDFEPVIDQAKRGDLVFADPPYTVRHNHNGFIKYNEQLFSWSDQERLAACLARAKKRGAKVIATNANHESIQELFTSHGFNTQPVSRFSSISGKGGARKQYEELIITN